MPVSYHIQFAGSLCDLLWCKRPLKDLYLSKCMEVILRREKLNQKVTKLNDYHLHSDQLHFSDNFQHLEMEIEKNSTTSYNNHQSISVLVLLFICFNITRSYFLYLVEALLKNLKYQESPQARLLILQLKIHQQDLYNVRTCNFQLLS